MDIEAPPMRCFPSLFWPVACLASLAVPLAKAEKLVVARSTVSGSYVEKRTGDGKLLPQTYVFMAGGYIPGTVRDNGLEKTPFRTIAERLASDLRRQEFHPAASLSEADLLLIVHWGVTTARNRDNVAIATSMESLAGIGRETEETKQNLADAIARGDMLGAASARGQLNNMETQTKSEYQTINDNTYMMSHEDRATLLGISAELRKDDGSLFGSARHQTLLSLTQEERYFLVVMAYDVPTFLRTQQLKRVWTMRASIRSAGINFSQALDRMGNVAGRYFGTRQESVALERAGDRKGKEIVKFGDIVVLGATSP